MRDQHLSTLGRALRVALAILAAGAGLAMIYSCSLIVDTQSQQCQTTADCTLLAPGAICETTTHVCVIGMTGSSGSSGSTSSSSGGCDVDGGIDGGGCYACAPGDDAEYLNACTTGCIAFDNTRVGKLDGGVLPPLPLVGPDGGM